MLTTKFSDFVSCKICCHQFNSPRLLPCQHSFCTPCLEKMMLASNFSCPFCQSRFSSSTTIENLPSDLIVEKILQTYAIKQKFDSSTAYCSECDEVSQGASFCPICKMFLCQDHTRIHQISKATKSHQLISSSDSLCQLPSSSTICGLHNKPYEGFCQSCFELCCSNCIFSSHKAPDHFTYLFSDANEFEETEALNYLIQEGLKVVEQIKSSIQEIDQMFNKAQQRSSSLINALNKFFFEIFAQILPEIQENLAEELKKNEKVLQDQKTRAEIQLQLLENELSNAKSMIRLKNIQQIASSKVELYQLFSLISTSFSVPQRTDNINLSCSGYIFNNSDEELNLADQQLIISSIVKIFNQLFGIKFTIPTLTELQNKLKVKQNIFEQQKVRKEYEEQLKINKSVEENETKEKSKQTQEKKKQDFLNIHFTLHPLSFDVPANRQLQINKWIGKKKWQLLYQATKDGFQASDFHSRCDNQGPTVTIITSKDGYLFGGYTPLSWSSKKDWGQDSSEQSFIFTLKNPHNIPPTKYLLLKSNRAIRCSSDRGPTFGNGFDIYVCDQSDKNSSSYTSFPHSYSDTTGKGNETFTGTFHFFVKDIEVFHVSE